MISNYINNINKLYQTGDAREHSYRGDLQQFLKDIINNDAIEITYLLQIICPWAFILCFSTLFEKKTSINLRVKLMTEGNPYLHIFLQTPKNKAFAKYKAILMHNSGLNKNSHILKEKDVDELIVKFVKKRFYGIDTNIDFKQMQGSISDIYRIRKANIRIIVKVEESEIIIEAIV